ncbi:endonuclease III [Clostridium sp. CM028]|uniref:endonuclease III n=1 Tax=unclassified Clostridium TaxID=2614128 RepID=UPI001C0CDDA0|nr:MULTISPECIES: endonuclease III [unclassified Clostridium]MBU3093234.1 endonuclease III [Clostridium sp. CF011]MBW9147201.1 endonuclease III [Clostridium sp. CM027]MBW9150346.1 endonuclease III [Clostridium sp. CM028]UVE39739.1 endonuclease III [Clostridium sp. CM027]WAG68647.1 endonuclease III [Clostridium sp. CF011]
MNKKTIKAVLEILNETYAGTKCGLDFTTHYELLVSTILSAQCTDDRVNIVTKKLYKKYNTPESMIALSDLELGEKIKSCGFYNNKSKNILGATKLILEKYNGEVPSTMEELIDLPGVGRKTANVVLSNAFGIPAIAVDTHVFRVSNRIGLAPGKNVYEVEQKLMKNIPKKMWSDAHHYIIWHGRKICKARKPNCEVCPIAPYCEFLNGKGK